jgi:hypothetical protein
MIRALRIIQLVAFLAISTFPSGCGGGAAEVKSHTTTTTLCQELMDLDKAYKQGVITEEQYNTTKKKLLEKKQ